MQKLYHCCCCGFISTLRNQYKNLNIEGRVILTCLDCQQRYQDGDPDIVEDLNDKAKR